MMPGRGTLPCGLFSLNPCPPVPGPAQNPPGNWTLRILPAFGVRNVAESTQLHPKAKAWSSVSEPWLPVYNLVGVRFLLCSDEPLGPELLRGRVALQLQVIVWGQHSDSMKGP